MATTILPSNLIVSITESYTLNEVSYGNTMTKTYVDNDQVSQRVMSISKSTIGGETNVFTDILSLDTVDGRGQVVKTNYRYFRINNLDTANTLNLRFFTSATEYVAVKVSPASTFLLMDNGLDTPANATTAISFAEISAIAGQSSSTTEDIDVEFIMVTGVDA